jgi:hypothetical protein
MASNRRQQVVLGALLVVLAIVIYWQLRPQTAVPASPPSNPRAARTEAGRAAAGGEVPDVQLEALQQERPKGGQATRNIFRFKPAAPPPRPAAPQNPPPRFGTPPPLPPVAGGVPPIPLQLIGIVEDDKGKLAALTDDKGVYAAREGTSVEGRYRVVSIGDESVVVEHIDGRGRQTIPLSNRQP